MADDLTGFRVEAADGEVGAIKSGTTDVDAGFLVVDPDPRFFAKRLMVPGDVVAGIDLEARVVRLKWTKEKLKDAPQVEDEADEIATDVTSYYDHELDPFSDTG